MTNVIWAELCRMCSSFVKHWDKFQGGERKRKCKGVQDIQEIADANVLVVTGDAIKAYTDDEIFNEARARMLVKDFVTSPLYEAGPTRLIHELRRQAKGVDIEEYYGREKRNASAHGSDEVGAEILELTGGRETRRKRVKYTRTVFEPRAVTDYQMIA